MRGLLLERPVSYILWDPSVVRGLDYYQDTIFEIMVDDQAIGAKSTICGGGRYDGLVEALGDDLLQAATPGFDWDWGRTPLLLLSNRKWKCSS